MYFQGFKVNSIMSRLRWQWWWWCRDLSKIVVTLYTSLPPVATVTVRPSQWSATWSIFSPAWPSVQTLCETSKVTIQRTFEFTEILLSVVAVMVMIVWCHLHTKTIKVSKANSRVCKITFVKTVSTRGSRLAASAASSASITASSLCN